MGQAGVLIVCVEGDREALESREAVAAHRARGSCVHAK